MIIPLAIFAPLPMTVAAESLVLTNADIFTVSEDRDWAEAILIHDEGIIAAIGSEADVLAAAGVQPPVSVPLI